MQRTRYSAAIYGTNRGLARTVDCLMLIHAEQYFRAELSHHYLTADTKTAAFKTDYRKNNRITHEVSRHVRSTNTARFSVTPLSTQSVLLGSPKSNICLVNFGLLLCLGLMSGFALPAKTAVTIDYSYDDLNRLQTLTRTYQYDAAGNFTTQAATNCPNTEGMRA